MDVPSQPSLSSLTAHLCIAADRDPQIAIRVLHRFAERGELPLSFSARLDGADALHLELQFDTPPDCARLLARRLQNLPSVRSVALSFRHNIAPVLGNRARPQPA